MVSNSAICTKRVKSLSSAEVEKKGKSGSEGERKTKIENWRLRPAMGDAGLS